MSTGIVPFKTAEGHDELARRTRRLGQRFRTVLLLVDGRRSVDEVLALARAAGVDEAHYRELLQTGLIAVPEGVLTEPTQPVPLDEPPLLADAMDDDAAAPAHVELPVLEAVAPPVVPPPAPPAVVPPPEVLAAPVLDVVVPTPARRIFGMPALELAPKAAPPSFEVPDTVPDPLAPAPTVDGPLEEARDILIRAVRAEAPVAGQLTLLKLKHASDRADLQSLLDEVESRIARPRKIQFAAQTLTHVRGLLSMPPSTAFTMY